MKPIIKRFGYDIYELANDLGSVEQLSTHNITDFNGKEFDSIEDALKTVSVYLNTEYRNEDWWYDDCDGDNVYVLHIIVAKYTHEWATQKMITEWRNGNLELVDLLVNVEFED